MIIVRGVRQIRKPASPFLALLLLLLAASTVNAQSGYSATILKTSQYQAPLCPGTEIT